MVDIASSNAKKLSWIEDQNVSERPYFDDFSGYQETFTEKLTRKIGHNWLVPIGLLATTACLTLGLINLKRGDTRRQQFYMRGRVICQGLTLLAMSTGVIATAINGLKSSDVKTDVQKTSD